MRICKYQKNHVRYEILNGYDSPTLKKILFCEDYHPSRNFYSRTSLWAQDPLSQSNVEYDFTISFVLHEIKPVAFLFPLHGLRWVYGGH